MSYFKLINIKMHLLSNESLLGLIVDKENRSSISIWKAK